MRRHSLMPSLDHASIVPRLRVLQADIRASLRGHMRKQAPAVWSRTVRDDAGDTIFGIDAAVEGTLLDHCRDWGRDQQFTLLAEGLEPEGIPFGKPGLGGPPFRLMIDPIDGTRGLMFDKRSAWSLAGVAPDRGAATRLEGVEIAVMTELPTTRQATSDVLWAIAGRGAHGERHDIASGGSQSLPLVPSQATTLRHGFATVANFFPGGKALLGALEEAILLRALGAWNPTRPRSTATNTSARAGSSPKWRSGATASCWTCVRWCTRSSASLRHWRADPMTSSRGGSPSKPAASCATRSASRCPRRWTRRRTSPSPPMRTNDSPRS
jgi:hypothetical protein